MTFYAQAFTDLVLVIWLILVGRSNIRLLEGHNRLIQTQTQMMRQIHRLNLKTRLKDAP